MSKWEMVKLGDIASLITKGTTPTTIGFQFEDSGINFVKIESITEAGVFIEEKFEHISEECNEKMKRSILCKNDILFSIAGALGRTAIVSESILPANTNQALAIIRIPKGEISCRYIKLALKSSSVYRQFQKQKQGVAQLNLSLKNISDLEIPLPPLDVQKHIADILGKTQEIIDGHKRQLEELDNLIKATFYDMFGDPVTNEKRWVLKAIGTFSMVKIGPFGSLLHVDDYIDGGFPLVNPSHIIDGKIVPDMKLTLSNEKFEELKSYTMQKGDIVVGRRGEIGRCAIVEDEGFLCGTGSMFIRIEKDYLPIVLQHIISSDTIRDKLEHQSVGVTMKNLNAGTISNLAVPLIPLSVQNKFAQIVTNIEEQKSIVKQSITESQNLFNSLMSRYFD